MTDYISEEGARKLADQRPVVGLHAIAVTDAIAGSGNRGVVVASIVFLQIALLVVPLTFRERVDMLRGREDEADGID